tara:strand:- start:4775 stop:5077 length:303 start_codon:yes stop_codon:yes gene_type:complete
MKKLILASVFTFVGLTAFAQENDTAMASPEDITITQDGFTEIEADKLPEAVTAALAKDFPTATLSKAYVNEKSQYKLEIALEDGTSNTLYADAEGKWLDM